MLLALFLKRENNISLQSRDFWKPVKIIHAPYRLRGEKFVQKSSLNSFVLQLLERHVLPLNTSERQSPGAKADTKKFKKNILSAAQANPLSWLREVLAEQLNSWVLNSTKYQKIYPLSLISYHFLYVFMTLPLVSFCFYSFLCYFCLSKQRWYGYLCRSLSRQMFLVCALMCFLSCCSLFLQTLIMFSAWYG